MTLCSWISSTIALTSDASTRPPENRESPADPGERRLDARGVVVRHDQVLEECPPGRDPHGGAPDAAGPDHQDAHAITSAGRPCTGGS